MNRLSIILALVLWACGASAAEFSWGPFQYEIMTEATYDTPGTARCIGLSEQGKNQGDFASVIFPEIYYNGKVYYINEIKTGAFGGVKNLVSLTIGYGVKTIGFGAFNNCTGLRTVKIPSSVDFSFNYIFNGCTNLNRVRLGAPTPPNVMAKAFPNNADMTLEVPYGLADINAYKNTASLAMFGNIIATYDANDIEDEYGALYVATKAPVDGVGELTMIGYTGHEFGETSFSPADNAIMVQGNEMRIVKIGQLAFDNTTLTSVDLSNLTFLKSLATTAFVDNDNLTSIILNNGLETIGSYALSNSSSLTSINIPKTVKKIGDNYICDFIDGCSSLSTITVDSENPYFAAYNNMLFSKDLDMLWRCPEGWKNQPWEIPGKILLPEVTREIGEAAFASCNNIVDVRIPYNVEMLYSRTFSRCANLEIVRLPSSLWAGIGTRNFEYCPKLKTITMAAPSPTELLDHDADNSILYGCGDVTLYVTRANSSALAEYNAAHGYDIFAKIEQSGEANDYQSAVGHQYVVHTPYNEDTPDTKGKLTLVGFIPTRYTNYSLETWLDPTSPNPDALFDPKKYEIFIIADRACMGLRNLDTVVIPGTVRTIGTSAFEGSSVRGSVYLPYSVMLLKEKAFYGCDLLEEIMIERSSAGLMYTNAFGNNASNFTFYVPWNGYKSYKGRIDTWSVSDAEKEAALKHMSSYIDATINTLRVWKNNLFLFGHPVDFKASGMNNVYAVTGYNPRTRSVETQVVEKAKENTGLLITDFQDKVYKLKRIELAENPVSNNLLVVNTENAEIPADGRNYTYAPSRKEFKKMTEAAYPTVYLAMPGDTFPDVMSIIPSEGILGDVNGDGLVDVADVNAIINLILGLTDEYRENADLNNDNTVDVSDVNMLIDFIIG